MTKPRSTDQNIESTFTAQKLPEYNESNPLSRLVLADLQVLQMVLYVCVRSECAVSAFSCHCCFSYPVPVRYASRTRTGLRVASQ